MANQTIQNPHLKVARQITPEITDKIRQKKGRYIITIAGESGCGKTETAKAFLQELQNNNINTVLLGQDDYFALPPAFNDARRKADPLWIGPFAEVRLDLLNQNILDAINGKQHLSKPDINYSANTVTNTKMNLDGIKVIIIEGTYVSLLRHIDTRIFIASNWKDTLPFRQKRNRGNEVHDPFVENILLTEHLIIAGHRYLADYILSKDYEITRVE